MTKLLIYLFILIGSVARADLSNGTSYIFDSSGNALNSTSNALNSFITNSTLAVTQSGAWTTGRTWTLLNSTDSVNAVQSGTWTVQQGTPPWSVSQSGTWNVGLSAGSNLVGKVGIDQTTPGTTNGVQVNAALPTGTNSIGQVTANAGTNLNTSALALSASQTNGTQKTQIVDGAGSAVGPVQTISGTNYAPVVLASSATSGAAIVPRSIQVAGSDGTNAQTLSVDSTGKLNINNISGTVSLPTLAATSTKQSDGTQKSQTVDGSGNVQPSGDVLTRKIFVQPTDGSNNQGYTASNEAKVLVTPLTNSSVVKAQLQDNSGTAITVGQKTMSSSVPVVLSSDQTGINRFLDSNGAGTISALNGAVTITTNGASNVYSSITGTWVASLVIQGDSGDGTWAQVLGKLPYPSGLVVSLIGSNVSLKIPCGGYKQIRIIATAYTSGTATVTWNAGAGVGLVEVFNNDPAALQSTTRVNDGSGNAITSTSIVGSSANQPLDVNIHQPASMYYCAPVRIRQSAATATGATVWSARFSSGSKTAYVERIELAADFDAGTPIGRALQTYDIERISVATPTGGSAITVVQMDTSDAATSMTDVRFVDTGLTTTGVTFGTAFASIGVPASDGAVRVYQKDHVGMKLANGEGIAIRLNGAAIIGQGLSGEVCWSER